MQHFANDDYVPNFQHMGPVSDHQPLHMAPIIVPVGPAALPLPITPTVDGDNNGENVPPVEAVIAYKKDNLEGYRDFTRISRTVAQEYNLATSKLIGRHPNYYAAILEVIKRYNRLGLAVLDFKSQQCRDGVGHRLRRAVTEVRRYQKDKAADRAIQENAENNRQLIITAEATGQAADEVDELERGNLIIVDDLPTQDAVLYSVGDIVCVCSGGIAMYLARIIDVSPTDADSNYITGSVEVVKLFALGDETDATLQQQEHIVNESMLQKVQHPLRRIHNTLGSFLQVEEGQQINSPAVDMTIDQESGVCNSIHRTGDVLMLDLGDQWAECWPLVAVVNKVKGMQVRIKWLNGVIDGKYEPWKDDGRQRFQNISINAHYFCGFELENGYLPVCARDAAKKLMEQYAEMETSDE